jgi:hypothetical protein
MAIQVVGEFSTDQHGVEEVAAIGNLDAQGIGLGCGRIHGCLSVQGLNG